MTSTTVETAADLRAWANGGYGSQAAVELLIRGFGGRFAQPNAWVRPDDRGGWWLDADEIMPNIGALSGGEQRFLRIVASLEEAAPFDLSNVAGLDREHLALVLAAVAHASGSHEHSVPVFNPEHTAIVRMDRPGSLYPWPEEAS